MNIGEKINAWLTDILSECIQLFVKLFNEIIGLNTDDIGLIGIIYALFVSLCGVFLLCIVLYRVLTAILSEAEGSEVAISRIIIDTFKSSAAIPIMTFAQGVLQNGIIFPLIKYLFNKQGGFAAEAITGVSKVSGIELTGFTLVLFLLFFTIVFGFFFFKMCKFYAEMVQFNLATPIAAVSIATENFDYSQTWWKKLVYINISILSQVISLTLMIFCITRMADSFIFFMFAIGSGALVLGSPKVVEDLWSSTGTTKRGLHGAGRFAMNLLRKH